MNFCLTRMKYNADASLLGSKMARFIFIACFVVLATYPISQGLCAAKRSKSDPTLPNIIIIFIDDQGYGDIGPFGAKGYKTPNLDRMAAEGCKYTNFHVPQPVCTSSRAGLMTGCYPNRISLTGALMPRMKIGIADTEMTMAQLVKQKGYATGIAGKWHLGSQQQFLPLQHGFDEYFGLPYSNDMAPRNPEAKPARSKRARKTEKPGKPEKEPHPPLPLIEGNKVIKAGLTDEDQDQLTIQYTERAVKFIEKNKDRPFFFYLAHTMVHVPLHVSERFRGKSERGLYGDACMEVDWSVGEVLAALKRCGIDDRTWVIYTSDNGPWLIKGKDGGSAGPLREGKGTCWEGGTREPTLMRWPGVIPAGSTCDHMMMTIDLFPTIAKLIGAKLPDHKIDGLDVWPLIMNKPGAKNPHDGYVFYDGPNELQAVSSSDGRWKLQLPHTYTAVIGGPDGKVKGERRKIEKAELYDLVNDIGETKNIAAANPQIVAQLEALAEKMRAELGDSLTGTKTGSGTRKPGRVP